MQPLANTLPNSDDVLFVFCDFETTQDTKFTDSATVLVPNLVCLQQFCAQCETKSDIDIDCTRCGKRKHAFFVLRCVATEVEMADSADSAPAATNPSQIAPKKTKSSTKKTTNEVWDRPCYIYKSH